MPALDGLPDEIAEVGAIHISVTMDEGGLGVAYGLEGVTPEAAIGYLQVVSDRLRDEKRYQWDCSCGECGLDDEDDEEDEGDE